MFLSAFFFGILITGNVCKADGVHLSAVTDEQSAIAFTKGLLSAVRSDQKPIAAGLDETDATIAKFTGNYPDVSWSASLVTAETWKVIRSSKIKRTGPYGDGSYAVSEFGYDVDKKKMRIRPVTISALLFCAPVENNSDYWMPFIEKRGIGTAQMGARVNDLPWFSILQAESGSPRIGNRLPMSSSYPPKKKP